jgi:hypothetical protein
MRSLIDHPVFTGLLLTLTLAVPISCREDKGDDDTDDIGDDEADGNEVDEVCKSSCQACGDLAKAAYACMASDDLTGPIDAFECIVCDNDGEGSAQGTCETQANLQSLAYSTMDAQLVACEHLTAASCRGWAPSQQVLQTDTYEWDVESDLIDDLVADPSQLVECDDARVQPFRGAYQVDSAKSGDLLDELGLVNGDVIRTINGYSMASPFEVASAFFHLWPGTTVFTVSVLRPGVGVITLTYNLV